MTPEPIAPDEIATLRRRVEAALAPCLWHGTEGGPHGPQPAGGVRFCAQCERRHEPLLVAPALLSLILGGAE
jgi:hypothetical protein